MPLHNAAGGEGEEGKEEEEEGGGVSESGHSCRHSLALPGTAQHPWDIDFPATHTILGDETASPVPARTQTGLAQDTADPTQTDGLMFR